LKGQVKDTIEVLTSADNVTFTSAGFLHTDLRRKDIPVNFMLPDSEELTGATFRLIPPSPIQARYVQYKVSNPKRTFVATEIEVLDSVSFKAFDLRIALPAPKSGGVAAR